MIQGFQEGETYTNPKLDHDIMVLGIAKETDSSVTLAILKVDRASEETSGGGQLTVNHADYGDWTLVQFD